MHAKNVYEVVGLCEKVKTKYALFSRRAIVYKQFVSGNNQLTNDRHLKNYKEKFSFDN